MILNPNLSVENESYESLTLALELLEEYRENMHDIDIFQKDSVFSLDVTKKYYGFMDSLKIILSDMEPVEKFHYFTAFKILVDMAFNKMQSEVKNVQ